MCMTWRKREVIDEVVDHVGIYGSKGAEGLSGFNAGLVNHCVGEHGQMSQLDNTEQYIT